mmetsp:Transcript_6859/g.9852  ORF Transcript_6859/g.9852 Transcript_6859/m.9852 type:complete len:228 (-) Transcript_6859:166-849(-)
MGRGVVPSSVTAEYSIGTTTVVPSAGDEASTTQLSSTAVAPDKVLSSTVVTPAVVVFSAVAAPTAILLSVALAPATVLFPAAADSSISTNDTPPSAVDPGTASVGSVPDSVPPPSPDKPSPPEALPPPPPGMKYTGRSAVDPGSGVSTSVVVVVVADSNIVSGGSTIAGSTIAGGSGTVSPLFVTGAAVGALEECALEDLHFPLFAVGDFDGDLEDFFDGDLVDFAQ